MTTFESVWRCDFCGESATVTITPVELDAAGDVLGEVRGADVLILSMSCQICGGDMRRVQSAGELRDWGHAA